MSAVNNNNNSVVPPSKQVCCSNCNKPLGMSSLSPAGTKRFCSQECMAVAMGSSVSGSSSSSRSTINITKRPANSPMPNLPKMVDDHDGGSSRSSMDDGHAQVQHSSTTSSNHLDAYKPPKKKKKKGEEEVFEWTDFISNPDFIAASVIQVKHAPLSRMWENISDGMKLEVENKDVDCRINETAFWVASVIKIQGYYVLLRYEGFGNDASGDFWIHLCSESIHHVGWCANKGKPLIPPKSIAKKFTDWRSFLVHRLTGARTLPAHFTAKLESGVKSVQKVGDMLEVVDKNQISQLKVATVTLVVGRRLHVEYWDNDHDGGFWCHEESRLIHPVGWAKTIGHRISSPDDYDPIPLPTTPYDADFENMNLKTGMKLEAIDPLNLSAICAATIKKVLKRGYVMVRIDCYDDDSTGFDWFCYHISSNSVFPCGFSRTNGVVLTPPNGWDKVTFEWEDYFRETQTVAAPIKPKEKVLPHGFKEGMKIEAADLMDPRLICVATVGRVVGRLLKIHFDGWEDEYDQWMDARSPDIYPIGWCELVKHRLEPPRPPAPIQKPPPAKKTKKGKKKVVKGAKQNNNVKSKAADTIAKPTGNNNASSTTLPKSLSISHTVTSTAGNNSKPISATSSSSSSFSATLKTESKPSSGGASFNGNPEKKEISPRVSESDTLETDQSSDPQTWSIFDVAQFLTSHDCAAYCEFFTKNNVDGKKLVTLSKDNLINLTGGKVGPAVKIYELICQLKRSTSAAKARSSALNVK